MTIDILVSDGTKGGRMKTVILAMMAVAVSSCAFEMGQVMDPSYKAVGKDAMNFCVGRYRDLSGNDISEADRANVLITGDKVEILFTKGEVGSFGKRDREYKAVLFCGVLLQDGMKIYDLHVRLLEDPWIWDESLRDIAGSVSGITWELLYIRDGDAFKFAKAQIFSEARILSNQPPLPVDDEGGDLWRIQ